jgi:Flp pilus assembly protein TadG
MTTGSSKITTGSEGLLMTRILRGLRSTSGASVVEIALVLPLFLILLVGVIDGGRVMFSQAIVYFAAQEATRWAVANPKEETQSEQDYINSITDYATSRLILISKSNSAAVSTVAPPDPSDGTRTVSVTINYTFDFILPFLGIGPLTLSASSAGFLIPDLG